MPEQVEKAQAADGKELSVSVVMFSLRLFLPPPSGTNGASSDVVQQGLPKGSAAPVGLGSWGSDPIGQGGGPLALIISKGFTLLLSAEIAQLWHARRTSLSATRTPRGP